MCWESLPQIFQKKKIDFRSILHYTKYKLRASLSAPFLLTLPDLDTPRKGAPSSPPCICPPKQRPQSLLLAIFLGPPFSTTGVRNSPSEFCAQHCFKCFGNPMARNELVLIYSASLLTKRCCFRQTDAPRTKQRHHHYPSINREGRLGTTDDFTSSFLHFSPVLHLWDLLNRSILFLRLPRLLPPSTVPSSVSWRNIGHIRSEYELVQRRFQRFSVLSVEA